MTIAHRASLMVIAVAVVLSASEQPSVRVAPMQSVGPRPVEKQTETSVIRDYLQAWQTLDLAMTENRPEVLDAYFVGIAKDKLSGTIREQRNLGIQTAYHVRSHDVQGVFYSPEGLSLQLVDTIEYDQEVHDRGKTVGSQHVKTRYIAVLTPTESKWKVRVLQSGRE